MNEILDIQCYWPFLIVCNLSVFHSSKLVGRERIGSVIFIRLSFIVTAACNGILRHSLIKWRMPDVSYWLIFGIFQEPVLMFCWQCTCRWSSCSFRCKKGWGMGFILYIVLGSLSLQALKPEECNNWLFIAQGFYFWTDMRNNPWMGGRYPNTWNTSCSKKNLRIHNSHPFHTWCLYFSANSVLR